MSNTTAAPEQAESTDVEICSICEGPIDWVGRPGREWKGGHNAEPINSGRCCTVCNDTVVIPVRLARMVRAQKARTD